MTMSLGRSALRTPAGTRRAAVSLALVTKWPRSGNWSTRSENRRPILETAVEASAGERLRRGLYVSEPLVVLDADVLGRRRTGDESYVSALLSELARLDHGLRLAAVTRRAELVPDGIQPIRLHAQNQILRMSLGLPRLLRRLQPRLAHFQHVVAPRCPCPAVVTIHDLSFERHPHLMGRRDRLVFRTMVPRSVKR